MTKKDAYYFSHDSNAKDDPKCMLLIDQLGLEGYGIFWVLVEILRDQPEYKYPVNLLSIIARRYNTTAEKMKAVVLKYNLFEIDADDNFFSLSLDNRMTHLENVREKRRLAGLASGKVRKLKALNKCSTNVQHDLNKNEQSKVKESKVKEKKYNSFISLFNNITNRRFKGCKKSKGYFKARLNEGYTISQIETGIINANSDKFLNENNYLTPEYILRSDKLDKWLNSESKKNVEERYKEHFKQNTTHKSLSNYTLLLQKKKDILYQLDDIITIDEFSKLKINGSFKTTIITFQNYGKTKEEFLTNLGIHVRKY